MQDSPGEDDLYSASPPRLRETSQNQATEAAPSTASQSQAAPPPANLSANAATADTPFGTPRRWQNAPYVTRAILTPTEQTQLLTEVRSLRTGLRRRIQGSGESRQLRCPEPGCNFAFDSADVSGFQTHFRDAHQRRCPEPGCDFFYKDVERFKKHYHDSHERMCFVPGCGFTYRPSKVNEFERHYHNHHGAQRCPFCPRNRYPYVEAGSSNEAVLEVPFLYHLKTEHSKELKQLMKMPASLVANARNVIYYESDGGTLIDEEPDADEESEEDVSDDAAGEANESMTGVQSEEVEEPAQGSENGSYRRWEEEDENTTANLQDLADKISQDSRWTEPDSPLITPSRKSGTSSHVVTPASGVLSPSSSSLSSPGSADGPDGLSDSNEPKGHSTSKNSTAQGTKEKSDDDVNVVGPGDPGFNKLVDESIASLDNSKRKRGARMKPSYKQPPSSPVSSEDEPSGMGDLTWMERNMIESALPGSDMAALRAEDEAVRRSLEVAKEQSKAADKPSKIVVKEKQVTITTVKKSTPAKPTPAKPDFTTPPNKTLTTKVPSAPAPAAKDPATERRGPQAQEDTEQETTQPTAQGGAATDTISSQPSPDSTHYVDDSTVPEDQQRTPENFRHRRQSSPPWEEEDPNAKAPKMDKKSRFYCSRCLRKAPISANGGMSAKEQIDAHMDPDRSCRIRNAVGSIEIGLPNRSGWIPESMIRGQITEIRTEFRETYPEYERTMYPLDPKHANASSWVSDPNNDSNSEAWGLPWPPYEGSGELPGGDDDDGDNDDDDEDDGNNGDGNDEASDDEEPEPEPEPEPKKTSPKSKCKEQTSPKTRSKGISPPKPKKQMPPSPKPQPKPAPSQSKAKPSQSKTKKTPSPPKNTEKAPPPAEPESENSSQPQTKTKKWTPPSPPRKGHPLNAGTKRLVPLTPDDIPSPPRKRVKVSPPESDHSSSSESSSPSPPGAGGLAWNSSPGEDSSSGSRKPFHSLPIEEQRAMVKEGWRKEKEKESQSKPDVQQKMEQARENMEYEEYDDAMEDKQAEASDEDDMVEEEAEDEEDDDDEAEEEERMRKAMQEVEEETGADEKERLFKFLREIKAEADRVDKMERSESKRKLVKARLALKKDEYQKKEVARKTKLTMEKMKKAKAEDQKAKQKRGRGAKAKDDVDEYEVDESELEAMASGILKRRKLDRKGKHTDSTYSPDSDSETDSEPQPRRGSSRSQRGVPPGRRSPDHFINAELRGRTMKRRGGHHSEGFGLDGSSDFGPEPEEKHSLATDSHHSLNNQLPTFPSSQSNTLALQDKRSRRPSLTIATVSTITLTKSSKQTKQLGPNEATRWPGMLSSGSPIQAPPTPTSPFSVPRTPGGSIDFPSPIPASKIEARVAAGTLLPLVPDGTDQPRPTTQGLFERFTESVSAFFGRKSKKETQITQPTTSSNASASQPDNLVWVPIDKPIVSSSSTAQSVPTQQDIWQPVSSDNTSDHETDGDDGDADYEDNFEPVTPSPPGRRTPRTTSSKKKRKPSDENYVQPQPLPDEDERDMWIEHLASPSKRRRTRH